MSLPLIISRLVNALLTACLCFTTSAFGQTSLSSVGSSGAVSNADSYQSDLSDDGMLNAFWSQGSNLVAGDTNGQSDIFVKNHGTGEIRLVSTTPSGGFGNGASTSGNGLFVAITPNGRQVAFESLASNLVSTDDNSSCDVFVRDLQSQMTRLVSTSATGVQGNGASYGADISDDGNLVVFASDATNLVAGDSNGRTDIFLKNLSTGAISRMNASFGQQASGGASDAPRISGDGRFVVFQSTATNLVQSDTNGVRDVYLRDVGTGLIQRINLKPDGSQSSFEAGTPAVANNGTVVYTSAAPDLVPGDSNDAVDLFIRRSGVLQSERPIRNFDGSQPQNGAIAAARLSNDARMISFESTFDRLVASDSNGSSDVFVYDLQQQVLTRHSVSGNGSQAAGVSRFAAVSANGRWLSFASTAANLVAGDTNGAWDVFRRQIAPAAASVAPLDALFCSGTELVDGCRCDAQASSSAFVVNSANPEFGRFSNSCAKAGVSGLRNSAGLPQTVTTISGVDHTGNAVNISVDLQGRVTRLVARKPGAATLDLRMDYSTAVPQLRAVYKPSETAAEIQVNTPIRQGLPAAAAVPALFASHPYGGIKNISPRGRSISLLSVDPIPNAITGSVPAPRFQEFNVTKCGAPVNDATVWIDAQGIPAPEPWVGSASAQNLGNGRYRVAVGQFNPDAELQAVQSCNAYLSSIQQVCDIYDEVIPGSLGPTEICTGLAVALASTGIGAAVAAQAGTVCRVGMGTIEVACPIADGICNLAPIVSPGGSNIPSFTQFNFMIPGGAFVQRGGSIVPFLFHEDIAPPTGTLPLVNISLIAPSPQIEQLLTVPADPAPNQSYVVNGTLFCLSPGVRIEVSGTDGYFDTVSCPASGNVTCSVSVPGGAQSVRDRISVIARPSGSDVLLRETFIVF